VTLFKRDKHDESRLTPELWDLSEISSAYAEALEVFERLGVSNQTEIEGLLARSRPSGSTAWSELSYDGGDDLARTLCFHLSVCFGRLQSSYPMRGIHQFSLSARPRIDENDLRKALFLATSATMFTPHRFEFDMDTWEDEGEQNATAIWSIDHDFVRDLFLHRELLRDGSVIMLPRSVT
jgi:hypothetical protein